jgi:AcrR family transcriptional regulator
MPRTFFVTDLASEETLKDRQYALTRRLLLDAAVEQLQQGALAALTMRAVAARAGVAERTAFRHFANRNELLDQLAVEVALRLELPPLPDAARDLVQVPRALFKAYESHALLTRAALDSELFDRIRASVARERWMAVMTLIDAFAPHREERERRLAAANIRYLLSASTWNYFRTYFGFSLKDSIAAAEQSITQLLAGLEGGRD